MASNVPPGAPKRRQGRMMKMSAERKARRTAKRARKRGTEADWRVRVWARRHIIKK